eukprot:GGOE01013662.1.p1 GENE.GGOE01013662.1~~GGOE01013662.1.p1  ORF type:complete len:179 (+),score=25.73 GGOE01013662.1:55-591(+)
MMKVSADPNNTAWANDRSRFGFLMLQKMGWTEGSGLGKSEQGEKDHIKVKRLPTGAGLGAATEEHVSWTVHKTAFEEVLSKLSARNSVESDSDSDVASPLTPLKRGMSNEEGDAERERKRQKRDEKKRLKKELEAEYVALGLTEEQKAERRAMDKQQRKEARAAKRQNRTMDDVSRGE